MKLPLLQYTELNKKERLNRGALNNYFGQYHMTAKTSHNWQLTQSFPVALLILLPASAWTRIVSANLWPCLHR